MDRFKIIIYAAGDSIEQLAQRLTEIGGGATVIQTVGFWDSGLGVMAEPAAKIEVLLAVDEVLPALGNIEEWLDGSDQTAVLVEVAPTIARELRRS